MPDIVAKVAKVVILECGCINEFPMVGSYSSENDWHVLPCPKCAVNRQPGVLERRAERAWNLCVSLHSGKRTEHQPEYLGESNTKLAT